MVSELVSERGLWKVANCRCSTSPTTERLFLQNDLGHPRGSMGRLLLRNETDLRRHMMSLRECFRVEAQVGGTVGLPDIFWQEVGCTIFSEIKVGTVGERSGLLRFSVRPDQRRTITRMVSQKIPVAITVGIKGTRQAWLLRPDDDVVLLGAIPLEQLNTACWARLTDIDDPWFMDDVALHARGKLASSRREAA